MYDTHAHVIGPPPHDDAWTFDAPRARLEDYLTVLDANGVGKGVLVQPFAHGFDNSLLLDAIAREPERLRGIAVVPPDVAEAELRRLRNGGICGVRLGAKVVVSEIEGLAPKLADQGMHLQLLMHGDGLLHHAHAIRNCPAPVVIDHLAHPDPTKGIDGAGFAMLRGLLECGHVRTKLSAVFRYAAREDYADAAPLFRSLIRDYDACLLWGSDWPFLMMPEPPDYAELLAFLREIADADAFARITTDNPRAFYGF